MSSASLGCKAEKRLCSPPPSPRQSVGGCCPHPPVRIVHPQGLPLAIDGWCVPVLALVTFKWSQASAYDVLGEKKLKKNAGSVSA